MRRNNDTVWNVWFTYLFFIWYVRFICILTGMDDIKKNTNHIIFIISDKDNEKTRKKRKNELCRRIKRVQKAIFYDIYWLLIDLCSLCPTQQIHESNQAVIFTQKNGLNITTLTSDPRQTLITSPSTKSLTIIVIPPLAKIARNRTRYRLRHTSFQTLLRSYKLAALETYHAYTQDCLA